ncbi:MAG: hypothetical protein M3355_04550 [Actinomycetota bacterium]|nr:hypothetical protein [Actinomycetota bacterium]
MKGDKMRAKRRFWGFSDRLTYANVMATGAMFFALGGAGAYAAATITGDDVVDESLTGKDIRNDSVGLGDVGFSPFYLVTGGFEQRVYSRGEAGRVSAPCPRNTKVVGGGWSHSGPDPRDFAVHSDDVHNVANGWQVIGKNVGGFGVPDIRVSVHALCVGPKNN